MKRNDDVFFFTLIDFLIQVLFFGLFLFVAMQAVRQRADDRQNDDEANIQRLEKWAGVSNLTEITDMLTKLAAPSELRTLGEVAQAAGGTRALQAKIEKLRKSEEGIGKPSCLGVTEESRAITLATVIADDTTLRFEEPTPELDKVLHMIGTDFQAVQELSLRAFSNTFGPVTQKKPDCRYTVRFIENTRLIDARDALGGIFYLSKSR